MATEHVLLIDNDASSVAGLEIDLSLEVYEPETC
jgi:hypothetical protein